MTRDYDQLHGRVSPQNEIVAADSLDAGHDLNAKTLSNSCDQKHSRRENRDAHVLVSCLPGFCPLVGYL
jgi:hypothetical protein